MRVKSRTDIFNLMDTNGRRDDVINALQGYLSILDEIINVRHMKWKNLPESTAQFYFYEQALRLSPDVFRRHKNYDDVIESLEEAVKLREAIYAEEINWIKEHQDEYADIFLKIDNGIEDRARHYTSNLVKLGFTDGDRNISAVGDTLLGKTEIVKDKLEKMLPVNDVNIIYLRQLLKLRIFTKEGAAYYSPFCMAVYALLKRKWLSQIVFAEIVQSQNPYQLIEDIDAYIENYDEGQWLKSFQIEIPEELKGPAPLSEETFRRFFTNRKTANSVDKYYAFYTALYAFHQNRTKENLDALLSRCEESSEILNKAFGGGKSIFAVRRGERPDVADFLETEEAELFSDNMNELLYRRFVLSKYADELREKTDTTRRIFKATGIISFANGYVELANKELCECIFDEQVLKSMVMGQMENDSSAFYNSYETYEGRTGTFFCDIRSMETILNYSEEATKRILGDVRKAFKGASIADISKMIRKKRLEEFAAYVDSHYPEEKVKELLALFSDRTNDGKIKQEVNPEATVPTIYEYIVGLAWYYFSNRSINILDGYQLTLSADFEPITHAGGGAGDIVIKENSACEESDQVIMLEATLMNANSQKRGEWEPVLRHSVNLKIEEEEAGAQRKVTTFFIADSFDRNTINIWKAVSSVPLQSSADKDKYTEHVIIMPVSNSELGELMDQKSRYNEIIDKVRALFDVGETDFDMEWREKFIREVI